MLVISVKFLLLVSLSDTYLIPKLTLNLIPVRLLSVGCKIRLLCELVEQAIRLDNYMRSLIFTFFLDFFYTLHPVILALPQLLLSVLLSQVYGILN